MTQRWSPLLEAKTRGLARYKGTICKNCQTNIRYTANSGCVFCAQRDAHNARQRERSRRVRAANPPTTYQTPKGKAIRAGKDRYEGRVCPVCKSRTRYVDTGKCVPCDQAGVTYYSRHREQVLDRLQVNRLERMLRGAKIRSEMKGWDFNITIDDLDIVDVCPVLGIPMDRSSLDRFDNSKGYVKGNVYLISFRANNLKSDATVEEMEKVLAYMKGPPPNTP